MAAKYIDSILPDAEDLLALEPEELAGIVIEHFNSLPANEQRSIHPDNFVNPNGSPVKSYPRKYQASVARALMEAWEWLVREGLLARQPGSPGWYFITRRGERMKSASDLEAYRTGKSNSTLSNRAEANSAGVIGRTEEPPLKGQYKIIRILTISEFAKTLLAEDLLSPSKRKCIVKQFSYASTDQGIYDQMLARFEREATVLEVLGDEIEQVPRLYAHFSENGKSYLVQEYIKGDTVATRIKNNGVMSEAETIEVIRSLLLVLARVHAKSKIHRDIKPENIVLREGDNKPFLIDFGAIKEIAQTMVDTFGNPSTSIVIGTLGYMPLEQVAGRPICASDLYALGLTAIFMLTGKRPAELNDPHTGEIAWRDQETDVSSEFAAVLDKAIDSDFRARFPGAQEMLAAFEAPSEDALTDTLIKSESAPTKLFVPSPSHANMPQVATWWLKDFLGPVIDVLNYIQKHFNNNSFELTASAVQPYSQVFDYGIDFFQRQRWDELLAADVGEYFLSRHPRIKKDLEFFQHQMDKFDQSLGRLLTAIEGSPLFLQKLIDAYERLVRPERIPRTDFAHFDLQEISVHLLGQLHLQISHHRLESKDALVRFTAYSLLGLNINFPVNSMPDDHKLLGFCRDVLKSLEDPSVDQPLKETREFIKTTKVKSTQLWKTLRQDRMEIANRYNATFE